MPAQYRVSKVCLLCNRVVKRMKQHLKQFHKKTGDELVALTNLGNAAEKAGRAKVKKTDEVSGVCKKCLIFCLCLRKHKCSAAVLQHLQSKAEQQVTNSKLNKDACTSPTCARASVSYVLETPTSTPSSQLNDLAGLFDNSTYKTPDHVQPTYSPHPSHCFSRCASSVKPSQTSPFYASCRHTSLQSADPGCSSFLSKRVLTPKFKNLEVVPEKM